MKNTETVTTLQSWQDISPADISLTEDYLTNALGLEVDYLLSFDDDQWLAGFRENAGLDMKGKKRYSGWEDSLIAGHAFGHYISACSYAYLSPDITKDEKDALYQKLTYVIDELKVCQDNSKGKAGFLWCAKIINKNNVEVQFDNVEKGRTNITTEAWVPWYTMHKLLQGVIDVYNNTGYGPALQVATALGDWVYNRTDSWSEATRLKTLATEYGGMNDCLYDLYAVTGEGKYAVAAHEFDEEALFENVLKDTKNVLNNVHANTTIPKFIGAMKRYIYTNGKTINGEVVDASVYLDYCKAFFTMVNDKHTYITGGNSEWEHFGLDYILDSERTNCNNETCNTYNMLKLAKLLLMNTGDKQYADFYENTYINAILSSQNPETGMTTYFQPMATGYFKVYSTPFTKFWCCTGTGMENFTRLGDAIYFANGDNLMVNLYLSSSIHAAGLTLTQDSSALSGGGSTFIISDASKKGTKATLRFRIPDWCASEPVITFNGNTYTYDVVDGYACISQTFYNDDKLEISLPMALTASTLPDNETAVGLKYGPIVLSACLGTEDMQTTTTGVAVTIPRDKLVDSEYILLPAGTTREDFLKNPSTLFEQDGLSFTLKGSDLLFTPHYTKYNERYGIYFYYLSDEENAALNEEPTQTEDTIVDTVQPGYGQYENDELHDMTESSSVGVTNDGTYRYAKAGGYFTYNFAITEGEDNYLSLTLRKEDNGKTLKITSDGIELFKDTLDYIGLEDTYTLRVAIPQEIIGKAALRTVEGTFYSTVPVTFESADANDSAKVCDFIYLLTAKKKYETDSSVAYFVDCGDHNVFTPPTGEKYGVYNSVSEQLYGYDRVTGKKWGLIDDPIDRYNGAGISNALYTANTWAYEFNVADNLVKEDTCRYTKNQYENGYTERYLDYYFELPNGTYDVEIGFSNPWSCSNKHTVYANKDKASESVLAKDYQVTGEPLKATVEVTDGVLTLNFRNGTNAGLAINVTYIKILFK